MRDVQPIDVRDPEVAQRVWQLQRAAYRVEADLIGFDGIPPLHETVDDIVAARLTWLGIHDDHGRLIAALAYCLDGETCDIDRLFVDPALTRQGYGRRLVEAVLDHPRVIVSTGTANAPARRLYHSLGFADIGTREIAPGVTVTSSERAEVPATDPSS
jgi:GNAT superfamily N-acetyltransferase